MICAAVLAQLAAAIVVEQRRGRKAYEGYWHIVYDAHCTSIGIRVKMNKNEWSVHRLPYKMRKCNSIQVQRSRNSEKFSECQIIENLCKLNVTRRKCNAFDDDDDVHVLRAAT